MISVKDIAFVRYQVTDFEATESFYVDFGLHRSVKTERALYMRTRGDAHHAYIAELGGENKTLGFGFYAQSEQDLIKLASEMKTVVEDSTEPGGGKRVRLTDPSGFMVDVIFGQTRVAPLPYREPLQFNPASGRKRLGQVIRLKPEVSSVTRLGHLALLVADFKASYAFYTTVLGLKPSDSYYAGDADNKIAAFMHCGLGQTFTDHHTLALITSPNGVSRFDHSAFEVLDHDDLVQGNVYLKSRGHKHSWGVGRHIQGSQLFDYWRDPAGNKVEHWTDGDLVNDETPVGNAPISNDELSQWGPALTPEFFL